MLHILPTKDAKILAELNREIQELHAQLYPGIFKAFDKSAVEKAFEGMLVQENCRAFLAQEADEYLGYLFCFMQKNQENAFQYSSEFLYLDQIHVQKKHRGRGIGKLLMQKTIELAKKEGLINIQLDHWSQNQLARGFFNKIGFVYCKGRMLMEI